MVAVKNGICRIATNSIGMILFRFHLLDKSRVKRPELVVIKSGQDCYFPCCGLETAVKKYECKVIFYVSQQAIILSALVAVALSRPENAPSYSYGVTTPSYGYGVTTPPSAPAKYDFNYAVNDPPSGNDFGHQEARDGPNTQGSYYVLLPDGRLQRVTYTVNGDSGYVADVTYEGDATPRPYTPAPQYA
ncbi:cuticle protein 19-like [Penaeus monodon]|uniref:cuticle protein 19-like n=1 Tax=Penaeus monodon TaxID=6687 RepID=UPI0018A78F54|nr:cuticle protein 19-like [Penaeus monodon]